MTPPARPESSPDSARRLLIVDDDTAHRDSLRRIFERAGYTVRAAEDAEAALLAMADFVPDVMLTDLVMPRMDGIALLAEARTRVPSLDVIVMTAYGTVQNAVAAMRQGAYDFVAKPIKRAEVLACVQRAMEHQALLGENKALRAQLARAAAGDGIVGSSDRMLAMMSTLNQVAASSATVLLLGESGTGKELCAKALHERSPRADGPFVAVNCAALPDSVLEAELFGHEKGAFTGAHERRLGRFERASGGTLFLDEVGDIPMSMQVKLLRALQEGEIERLGGTKPVSVDVRIVAATHVDLKKAVAEGRFREDLYYRLDVIALTLPPLRERAGDVALLALHFLRRFSERHKKAVQHIAPDANEALRAYHFPGNVRELENAIERAVVLCPGDTLRKEDLPDAIREAEGPSQPVAAAGQLVFPVGTPLSAIEHAAIDATLAFTAGDKQKAAKLLGMSLRTLYRRLDERPEA